MSRKRHKHTDTAADGKVLSWCLDDGVTEEEDSRDDSTDNHGISTAEKLDFSQTGCDKRTEDGADVGDEATKNFGVSGNWMIRIRRADMRNIRAPPVNMMSLQALLLCQVHDSVSEVHDHSGRANKITTSTEAKDSYQDTEANPVRTCSCSDRSNGCDEQSHVEGDLAADNISTKAPEQSTDQKASVESHSIASGIATISYFEVCLRGCDALKEDDEGVSGVTEAGEAR
ncbi:hypothetical protein HG531_009309 [Fusarium graminearum]|nr:hypothetical protein HG531_009309 [Fusarium graminearum]